MSVESRLKFARKHVTNKEGVHFATRGRPWVEDELFRPAEGYKLWPIELTTTCDECKDRISEIVETPDDNPTTACECGGLSAEPIIITVLNLQRQDGKTFSTMGLITSIMFQDKNKSIAFLCTSEDQAEKIFGENYGACINGSKALSKRAVVKRMGFTVPSRKNIFEALPASHKSVTGRSRTHIVIDEARDIPARIVMALLPSIFSMGGIECPRGHVHLNNEEMAADDAPEKCSACGDRLLPWFPRVIITSSSGILDGSESDWMAEMLEELEKRPNPNAHTFASGESLNPAKSKKVVDAVSTIFGALPSTRHYIAAEVDNQWTRKGVDFMAPADIKRAVDNKLINEYKTGDPCVAFLDTSKTVDLTSLVILAEDTDRSSEPFEYVRMARLDVWSPKDFQTGVIDDREILKHLDHVLPMFPGLLSVVVDVRGNPWAIRLVAKAKKGRSYSRAMDAWTKNSTVESQIGWGLLEARIRQLTIRMQSDSRIITEFKGVAKKQVGADEYKIVDRDRRRSHMDITETMACACYLAHLQQMGAGRAGGLSRRKHGDAEAQASVKATLSRIKHGIKPGRNWY